MAQLLWVSVTMTAWPFRIKDSSSAQETWGMSVGSRPSVGFPPTAGSGQPHARLYSCLAGTRH
jgi:hypothetical protein